MTKRELIDYCLTYPGSFEDYPFDEVTAVIKVSENKKMFALIAVRNDRLYINLKCDPNKSMFLRQIYKDLTPGYHMNKEHWNTIIIGGDVPEEEIFSLISHSYELVKPKKRKV